jgi:hypothetical protein
MSEEESKPEKKRKRQRSKDPQDVVIARRNKRLEVFFKIAVNEEIGEIKIISNENTPAVIINDEFKLSCYVHNFDLHFLNSPEGEIIYSIKLHKETEYDVDKFRDWLINSIHNKVHKIKLSQTPNELYLCGWNYLDKENGIGRYPVFAKFNPKTYFEEKKAQEFADELTEDGYLVEVV